LLSSILPIASTILTNVAERLTDFENYETKETRDVALIQKMLVINFITSYLAIFLTAFVYVPFGHAIVPYLDVFRATVRPFVSPEDEKTIKHSEFKIDPNRLHEQVVYFAVTAQVVNLFLETGLPFILQRLSSKYKQYSEEKANAHDKGSSAYEDHPDEVAFLKKVRDEADLPEYDTTDDLRQMAIQFGFLSLFSTVWPLVPVAFLFNNWLELRSDFFKICREFKRPVPERADTIGPWLDTLGLLAWIGSITSPALVYMFRSDGLDSDGNPGQITGWTLMTIVFFSEHIYLGVRYAVEKAMEKIEMPSVRKERIQKILLRKSYIPQIQEPQFDKEGEDLTSDISTDGASEKITRVTLEEDARARTLHAARASDSFWERQKNWKESLHIGSKIIQSYQSPEVKKHD
jgi:anoctamin-10